MRRRNLLIVIALIVAVLFSGAVWLTGTSLTLPARSAVGDLPIDMHGRTVEIHSASGATLRGWFLPGDTGGGAIILMHGIRASRLNMLARARFLTRAGYAVLLFDFQAHGESTGEQITIGYIESRDAQAAVGFLHTLLPNEKIGVIGVSMGGAATLLATPPLDVSAMVLESVYPTIEQAVANRLAAQFGGWARGLTPLLTWQLKPRLGVGVSALHPIDKVGIGNIPKLFINGAEDKYTTLEESRELFDAAHEPKEFWAVEHAAHVDLHSVAKQEYEQRVLAFFKKSLRA